MLNFIKKKANALYSWYKQGIFWRQVKIKLFRDYGGFKLYFPIAKVQKIQNNKIVCVSYHGVYHSGNPAFIVDELMTQRPDLEVVWLIDKRNMQDVNANRKIRLVDIYSYKAMYELASAKIWIDNSRKSVYVPKKENQFYLQTWHGGIALKTVEADAAKYLGKNYLDIAKNDAKNTDLMISNCKFCTDMYRRAFWYDGEIIEEGLPRNDFLVNHPDFDGVKLKEKLGIPANNVVLLYAPTFRGDKTKNPYIQDFTDLIKCLEEKANNPVTVLIKHHPNIRTMASGFHYIGNVIDVTDYPDIQHLYLISDYMITDYSSTMFEYGMLNKPVFLYVPDWKEYKENDREFYFSFEELPYMTAYSMEQLLHNIKNYDESNYLFSLDLFYNKVGLNESGHATQIIAKYLLQYI